MTQILCISICQPHWMGHGQHPNLKMDMMICIEIWFVCDHGSGDNQVMTWFRSGHIIYVYIMLAINAMPPQLAPTPMLTRFPGMLVSLSKWGIKRLSDCLGLRDCTYIALSTCFGKPCNVCLDLVDNLQTFCVEYHANDWCDIPHRRFADYPPWPMEGTLLAMERAS